MNAPNSLEAFTLYFEKQEDVSELPETLRVLRKHREKINLWRLKKSKKVTE